MPDAATFELFRGWREIFDRYELPVSPPYHAFRSWFGWPAVSKARLLDTHAERLDRREGRGPDPCAEMI